MKARDILQQYKEGRRDFPGEILRGLSFKGKDLSGADFSGADIRGTNFRGAILQGTNFQGAKGGLQKRWVVVLLIGVFIWTGISGFFSLLNAYIVTFILSSNPGNPILETSILQDQIFDWVNLILLILFWIVVIRWGIIAGFGTLTGAIGIGIAITFVSAIAIAIAGATAIAGAFTIAGAFAIAFAIAGTTTLLTAYIAYRAMKGDEKHAFILNIAIAFAATGGTCFREADLTDADFSNTTLKSTDFRKANLIRTCFRNAIKLDRVRPGKTYLQKAKVRELVKTGQGENQNFDRQDLQGANLQGANLVNASFIEANLNSANLQDADLSRAKLVGTFLDQTDLTGATLTGAFIEDWGITAETKLHGIRCDYIFMRLPPDKRPDFLQLLPEESLNPNPRRKPDDWEKNFEDGEFVDFITPMVETLDLYHNGKADPRIVAYSFQKLREDHPEAEIEMVSMEKRGKNREGLLIRAETAPQADHSELNKEYFQTYNRSEALPPEEFQQLLAEKDKQIQRLAAWVDIAMQRPNIYAENYSHQGDTKMSERSGDKIEIEENYGVAGKEGNFENYGATGKEGKSDNYGVVGNKQGKIQDTTFAPIINNAQQKTLAETAAEIQQLLEQLEQSNSTETTAGQMAVVTQAIEIVENNPTLKQRVIGALKSGGTEAFKEAINHPVANVLVAAFQGFTEP